MNKRFPISLLIASFFLLSAFVTPTTWTVFQKKDYAISFPGKPTIDSTIAKTELGSVRAYQYSYQSPNPESDSTIGYQLVKTSFPAKFPMSTDSAFLKGFFESIVKNTVARIEGKLFSEKEIMYKNYPGRDLIITLSDGEVISRVRIILAGQTVFAIQTVSVIGKENNADATRFYSSFIVE